MRTRFSCKWRFWLALALACVGLVTARSAHAIAGTQQIAWPGQRVFDSGGWPAGATNLINDPLRTDGGWPWFSGLPNDWKFFEYNIRNTTEANHLLQLLASIKTANLTLRLNSGQHHFHSTLVTREPEKNRTAVVFSLGNQRVLEDLHRQLFAASRGPQQTNWVEKSGRTATSNYWPIAAAPALTIYVGHPAIDLKHLEIPATVAVSADNRTNHTHSVAAAQAIAEFIANHNAKTPYRKSTAPAEEPTPHQP